MSRMALYVSAKFIDLSSQDKEQYNKLVNSMRLTKYFSHSTKSSIKKFAEIVDKIIVPDMEELYSGDSHGIEFAHEIITDYIHRLNEFKKIASIASSEIFELKCKKSFSDAEILIKAHFSEMNFNIAEEDLPNLNGFMVCNEDYRYIVIDKYLDPSSKISLYLHLLSHIILGHVSEMDPTIIYEYRDRYNLSSFLNKRELAADRMSEMIIEGKITMDNFDEGEHYLIKESVDAILNTIRRLPNPVELARSASLVAASLSPLD
jgi:hypothetical protein